MSLTNSSQVLLRNVDLLKAKQPLLVNLSADSFIDDYLSHFPQIKLTSLNSHFGEYQALKSRYGHSVDCYFSCHYQTNIQHDLAIISFPKSKAELAFTLAMIAPNLASNAQILLVGENKSGIKSTPKLTQKHIADCIKVDSARHCILFAGCFIKPNTPFKLSDWFKHYQLKINDISLTIASLPGVFSQNDLDVGTALLLNNLPDNIKGNSLDFGCGAGVISCYIGKKHPEIKLTLLDVSALAICSAKQTLALNSLTGETLASDGLSELGPTKFDHIVTNPPFHQGIKTNYAATETFLSSIKKFMTVQGKLTLVANNFLRYQSIMEQNIGKTRILITKSGFTVYDCQKKSAR